MSMDTATILDLLKVRIEALVPAVQFGADDLFRVIIGTGEVMTGPRQVQLTSTAGIRKPIGGQTCNDWESTITIEVDYADNPPGEGQWGAYSLAIQDAEDMLADIYAWSVTTAGILNIEPDPATIDPSGDGLITSSRTIFIQFERS